MVLEGRHVRLEPLHQKHAEQLVAAMSVDRSLYRWSFVPLDAAAMHEYVERANRWKNEGIALPFAIVRDSDGVAIGSSRLFDLERWQWPGYDRGDREYDGCEIGYSWLGKAYVRTAANTEAKLLMLTHAFETWHVRRVCFHTDERNERSRNALTRIGATFEGIVRAHRLASDMTPRNSARFSILESEWPGVKAHLMRKLGATSTL
ncbi:MAG: GNAT family N-acetyltransferase [Candidatus Eremiobacteraeota bacterium]|nr:GNAT family N-acetyltransferase [Candidatus Eremiobacteraeota bacterium]